MTRKLLMANEAFAWSALMAGVNVVAGYPGTPSSEIVETVAKLHAQGVAEGVYVEWSDNEKAALELLEGASAAGARVLFTCKQMGLNVASDALLSLNYIGVNGGFVLIAADDPGPISSQTEQDTRRFAGFAKVPVLDPATPEDGFSMIGAAFELSERYHTPVIVRPTTRVDHASAFFDVPERTQARPLPPEGFVRDKKWIIFPARAYQAHAEVNERLGRIAEEAAHAPYNYALAADGSAIEPVGAGAPAAQVMPADDATRGIAASGVSVAYVREALAMLRESCEAAGIAMPPYRLMKVGMAHPFPDALAHAFARGLSDVLVFEELDHVVEDALIQLAGRAHMPFDVHGKLDGATLARGENSAEDALSRIARFLGVEQALAQGRAMAPDPNANDPAAQPAARPPVLCPGCPHRGSFYAVKQALGGREAVLCGDIGCYTLGNAAPLDAVDTCLCMGAGITMAQGMSIVQPGRKHVAFVGDSTFFASGMTGIANAVYNQHDVTVCVLDNSTTAMTGSQPHPGTGKTLMGPVSEPIQIEAVLRALGLRCITRANPFFLAESIAAAKEAIDFAGPSAVIFKAPCIQLIRPEEPAYVDTGACTGCRSCIRRIGCPAISMAAGDGAGGKVARIDPSMCTGCGLCTDVCPAHAIVAPARADGRIPFADQMAAQAASLAKGGR